MVRSIFTRLRSDGQEEVTDFGKRDISRERRYRVIESERERESEG